jgi:mRNA interferase RelE/StbE
MAKLQIEFKPRAAKDLRDLDPQHRRRVFAKIEGLANNLAGDVKRLTNFTPEYRLRVGDYRVLFEVEADRVIIYRIKDRKDAYE